jgi:hypothetical protein
MLELARERTPEDCLYLNQDMRSFELYGTVRAVVSVCDSINYITDEEDLVRVFRLVNNYLDPCGIFLFDVNTEHQYRDLVGNSVVAEDRDDVSFIWYNYYDRDRHLNEIDLSVFIREKDDLYRKYQELASKDDKVWFGGRLGKYKYYDMDDTIADAAADYKKITE